MIILSVGIGALLTSVAFTRQPHLAYILLFRVFRLTILDHCSGLQLFTHDWSLDSNFFDPNLFSGMFQGLSGILRETLQKGFPREIYLEHAVVLLERSVGLPPTFVLIASKSSSSPFDHLQTFFPSNLGGYHPPNPQENQHNKQVGAKKLSSNLEKDLFFKRFF